MSKGDPVQGEFFDLQALYFDVNDRVQIALEDNQSREEARILQWDKTFEAHSLGAEWGCIYKEIDASLDEMIAQLKDGPADGIGQLEMVNIKCDAMEA